MLIPLQFFASLQRLDLVPAWPLLPNPFRISYFRPMVPPLPTQWNRRTLASYTLSLALSPLATYSYMTIFHIAVNSKLCVYARAGLPRPDNPDSASLKLGDDEASMSAPVLEYPRFQGSIREEFIKDVEKITNSVAYVGKTIRAVFGLVFGLKANQSTSRPSENHTEPRVHPVRFASDPTLATVAEPSPRNRTSQTNENVTEQDAQSSSTATPSPPATPTSSQEPDSPALEPSNVQIRTRTGSTSTLHMDVEVNAPVQGGPVFTSSFAASPRPTLIETSITQTIGGK